VIGDVVPWNVGVRMGIADAEEERGRRPVVLAVDQVADPADAVAEREP
jgi:hypothetical protein